MSGADEVYPYSPIELLTLPGISCQRFLEIFPQLKTYHPRLLERIDIEGKNCNATNRRDCGIYERFLQPDTHITFVDNQAR